MATLSIRSVTKRFGAVDAIRGVSLEIADGEFVALVGPSGCGKSTLLRMVAGLEEISSGAILLDGARIDGMPPKSRDMAMVFQSYALYPHKTVAENMGFALKMRKRPAEEIRRKVGEAAEILGLTPLLGRYPKELSGGQRQRVAMGRAIVREPKLFLFDEPLSNLDAKLRVQMRSEIKELRQRLGVTTLYVTHDQIEAMTLADRVVVMNHGVVEQEGPPLDLFDAPRNRFVAGFIGSPPMNFFEGTVGGGAFRSRGGVALPLPPDARAVEGAATYGVRPEHLRLAEDGAAARVIVVEPTGTETLLKLSFGAEDAVAVLRERLSVRPGDTLRVAVEPGRGHLFPPEARAAE